MPALVTGYAELLSQSKELSLLLNGLVSYISGIIAGTSSINTILGEGVQKLSALNLLSEGSEVFWPSVKEFRIIILVRSALNWADAIADSPSAWIIYTEQLRLMRSLLPCIKLLNGDFWGKTFSILNTSLTVKRPRDLY